MSWTTLYLIFASPDTGYPQIRMQIHRLKSNKFSEDFHRIHCCGVATWTQRPQKEWDWNGFSGDQKLHHVKNTIWDGTYRGQQNYNPKSSFSSKAKSPKLHKPLQRMESSVSVVELERDRRKRWSVNAGYKTLLTCGEDDTRTPAHERNAKEWSRGFRYYKRNAGGKSLNLWNDVYHTPATGVWRTLPRNIQNIEEKERADKAYASMLRKIHQEDLLHKRKKTLQKFYDAKLQRVILEEKAGMLPEQYKGYVEKPTYSGGDRNIISPHDGTPILKKTLKFYGQTSKKNLWDNVERLEDRQLRWKISADADLAAMKAIEKKVVRAHQLELLQNDARRQSINKTREKFRASREENLKAQLSISSPKTLRLLREGLPRPMKHSSSADYLATTKQRFEHPPHIPLSHTDYKDLYVCREKRQDGLGAFTDWQSDRIKETKWKFNSEYNCPVEIFTWRKSSKESKRAKRNRSVRKEWEPMSG
eukprot:jgi/Bigna1/131383/aug1.14_g6091